MTIPESSARAFLDKYKLGKGICPKCRAEIWVFQCHGQPHKINQDLTDHACNGDGKPKTIADVLRAPGGEIK